ncbi:MAG: chromosome segregation protein [Herbinix sp.]|nr:chromosome segregation protein [Herbinix sp.]
MDRYQVLKKMCLNNWHYISEKLLTFHDDINFFTGHSGSGKSTVLDALQIVLYADSNGRGFFNKAAKDDSDRTLIEYLRGMKVVQENNEINYLRNKNFTTSIVLEFQDTETEFIQSIGVIFDVDVTVNEVNRLFFWHTGSLLPNCYRDGDKVLSIHELKEYMKDHFTKEDYFFTRTNEKFRNELYGNYFGGLHPIHFPALFKKAIPFKMDIKLEDFVKNYICTENDIHMEDMQDSVAQYTRLKRRLEDTRNEIHSLTIMKKQYEIYRTYQDQMMQYQYNLDLLDIETLEAKLDKLLIQQKAYQEDMKQLEEVVSTLEQDIINLQHKRDEVLISIQNSGYDHLEAELKSLNQVLELLYRNKSSFDQMVNRLRGWLETDLLELSVKESIHNFMEYQITQEEIELLKANIAQVHTEIEKEKLELLGNINEMKSKLSEMMKQVKTLRDGQKAYPAYLLEAKQTIADELMSRYQREIPVDILADILEVKDINWLNAVEGYMGNNKLSLMVPPTYVKQAMELYQGLDPKKYYNVAVIDTERVLKDAKPKLVNALADEIETSVDYARAYVDSLLGAVIKCNTIEELRENKSGITSDCVLYQGYKLQHMNPRNYTEYAYIGHNAVQRRLTQLERDVTELQLLKTPLDERLKVLDQILGYETLSSDTDSYVKQLAEINEIKAREEEKQRYIQKINEIKEKNIDEWRAQQHLLEKTISAKSNQKESASINLNTKKNDLERLRGDYLLSNEELIHKKNIFQLEEQRDKSYQAFLKETEITKPEMLRGILYNRKQASESKSTEEFDKLISLREQYRKLYSFRGLSLTRRDNGEYDQLLTTLSSDKLVEFTEKANEQAKQAVYHFKTDFIYKIRDSIKEVMQQKDDLNRILAQLDFGKDKYRFIITKNKGEDGKFYDMFMDENLEINPHQLMGKIENQMDFFTMQHEKDYSDLINELIDLFIPPENCDAKTLEEARENMEKYSDYRTYLSFDMEQLVEGMPPMRLSKMLTKNSGGEGQNPLYVALLASFAQVYRINLKSSIRRKPTPRLVVLDEAFSKMDAEKVGSCIGLIRTLGFQAIISATNDKIQNYVDNVDKTFVFANPNKNRISIQEFEKADFYEITDKEIAG